MRIATVLLLEDSMGSNYQVVDDFDVMAEPGRDSCLPGSSTNGQCCVTRNLTVECQFGVNSSYLYGVAILSELSGGPFMIQTHATIRVGYPFNSTSYINRPSTLMRHSGPLTAQQVKMFQFIIGEFTSIPRKCLQITDE